MDHLLKSVRGVNLNLIPVLAELLRCKSVTHAASRLCLTQSAVSASLKRLREIFNDELLVMHGREMVLTEKASRLVPEIENVLESISALVKEERFDPRSSTHRYKIVTADYISSVLLSAMSRRLAVEAPGISMHVSLGGNSVSKEIQMGLVDLLIAPENLVTEEFPTLYKADSDFHSEVCMTDRLVAIESANNPERTEPISLDEYLSRPHASFSRSHSMSASVEHATLAVKGLTQNDQFIVPNFTMLPMLVTDMKDAISVVPESLAIQFMKLFPIRIFTPPIEFPSHNLLMIWGKSRHTKPEHMWLREMIRLSADGLMADTKPGHAEST